ncbi:MULTISPECIES: 23S rRNA (uracil(1939)-C(5))-methyltransferase RlmD [Neisseria]|uniref:23S rRNA (uracil(1939)-C(5))-methyltransferase RlmD n=1 Tax=Neisseria TaxID=482 RepID=UPI0027DF9586|nr:MULTISPECIES: 23S rRNA (uracil(1939)-C(5))-methyltransferase RlmD [Neisseria]
MRFGTVRTDLGVETEVNVAEISALDYEGRGVAKVGGKTVFIKGALPSERVGFRIVRQKKQFDEAEAVAIFKVSDERTVPQCRYFERCGGCSLQHISPAAQVAFKQRMMEEQLERIGKVRPQQILPPIYGHVWHYRNRARFSVSLDKSCRLKLGFQAKKTNDVVDISSCMLLPKPVSDKLSAIRGLLQDLAEEGSVARFAEFYRGSEITVLNIAFKSKLRQNEENRIRQWFDSELSDGWQVWLQIEGGVSQPFYPKTDKTLKYTLPEFGIEMPFRPGDFTQINADTNRLMVSRAVKMLDIRQGERIADLFCGLGNFSLPMAKSGADVVGIEGAENLVRRARQNARLNGCDGQTDFIAANLFDCTEKTVASWGRFDKMLIDPPRSGAYEVVKSLHTPYLPQKIVYVSCNPSTLARDAGVLVEKGYMLSGAGIMNMFAQTSHTESVAVFDLLPQTGK